MMNPPDSSLSWIRRLTADHHPLALVFSLLFLTVYTFSVALVPIRSDNDVWWHVKSGQYIAQNGLPEHDVFNFNAEHLEWHNHEWIAQVLLHWAHAAGEAIGFGGFRGVILFIAIVIWLTTIAVFLLATKLSRNVWIGLLIAVLCVAIGRRMFYPRPPVITNLFLIAELWLLVAVNEGWLRRAWLFLLVPMIALWTNVHGGWMAGGVILAAWALDQGLGHLRSKAPWIPTAPPRELVPVRLLLLLLPPCLLATFCNPYGWHLYELPARVMTDPYLPRTIGELAPPDFYFVVDFKLAIMGFVLLAVFAMMRGFRPQIFEVLIFAFFLHQALNHVRHLSLFSIMMVPLYARVLAAAILGWNADIAKYIRIGTIALTAFLASWVIINPREGGMWTNPLTPRSYPGRNVQYFSGLSYIREGFPAALCDLVELAEIEGRMFNENHYAGYLIWRLSPDRQKVFSDSRFDIFGSDILLKEMMVVHAGPEWREVLDEADVQWLIVRPDTDLAAVLQEQTAPLQWAPAAIVPPRFMIWIRNVPENAEMLERTRRAAALVGGIAP